MPFNTWTDPSIFAETQNVNSVVLNKYLSENMRYLHKRPRDIKTHRDVGNFTTTSSTLVAVSTTSLRLNITLKQQVDLRFWLNGTFNIDNTTIRITKWDILQNGTTYLSSLTGTALSNGLVRISNSAGSGGMYSAKINFVMEDVPAGVHYFDLYYATDANTLTLYTNPPLQFGVMEV